jgi:serine/threonine-protein kinase
MNTVDLMPLNSRVQPGDVLDGKYLVERLLAAGGMGVVVAARHLQLDERVAIKFLRDEILSNADAVSRFAREARTAIKIKSEHVARVTDVGVLADGTPYLVMEYLEGEDLAGWIRSRGALDLDQAVEFLLQACEAIAEAHALGIVHRDLKPANLFVTLRADGLFAIKVLDFGISKAPKGTQTTNETRMTGAVGSPSYMSPEQLATPGQVDARADIWALGVTFFEMLTAKMPFDAEVTALLSGQILRDPPRSLRELVAEAPDGVEAIINKCLEKDPANRYANVAQFARALVPFGPERAAASAQRAWRTMKAAGLATSVAPAAAPVDSPSVPPERNHPTRVAWGTRSEVAPSKRRLVGAFASALALVIGVGAFLVWRSGKQSPAPDGAVLASPSPPSSIAPAPPTSAATPDDRPIAEPELSPPRPVRPSAKPAVAPKRSPHAAGAIAPVAPATASSKSTPRVKGSSVFDERD